MYGGYGHPGDVIARQNPGVYVIERLKELSAHPEWLTGSTDWSRATTLYNQFKSTMGRDPTQSEINQIVPYYLQDSSLGNAYLEQFAKNERESPDALKKKAPEFFGGVESSFQNTLGRAPSDQEKQHFGQLLATGEIDEYTLGQYLQQLPEHVKTQDAQFRQQLGGELQGQDERYFKESIMPSIEARFAQQGRSVDSTGYASALANAATLQNRERESFLSNLSANQYAGRSGAAREDYTTQVARMYGNQDYAKLRKDQITDAYTGRANQLQDYDIQRKTYEDFMRRYGKQSSGLMGGLQGAVGGATAGSAFGPWGAGIGGVTGGLLGYFGSR